MKQAIGFTLAAILIFALAPLLAGGVSGPVPALEPTAAGSDAGVETSESVQSTDAAFDANFLLPILDGGQVRSMNLRDYLTGVLLAEMPMTFADEALKAQAVASRTYVLHGYAHRRHDTAAVCTDSGCCQGWRDPASVPTEDRLRAEAAVDATDGLVIRYQGDLIDAVFFSCSGGRTEAAAAVWGKDLPYLQSVDSPGEEASPHFTDEIRLPLEAFCRILEEAQPMVSFSADRGDWVEAIRYTPGGGVASLLLGGRAFTGRELRRLFSLRSTAFTLTLTETEAVFETRGYGHRVGMSQWGAEAMASDGADFIGILTHYYTGVTVEAFSRDDSPVTSDR